MTTIEKASASTTDGEFFADVTSLCEQARETIDKGPRSDTYGLNVNRVIDVLNQTLAIALACELRYKHHFFVADGLNAPSAADEFLEHAAEESEHADRIEARIQQLGGSADFYPDAVTVRGIVELDSSQDLEELLREDVAAEQVIVSAYTEIILWIGEADLATRGTLEEIVAREEERAKDLLDLLSGVIY